MQHYTPDQRRTRIDRMRRFPDELDALIQPLSEDQLRTRYLPGEWTVAQIVHHLADAHMNGIIRFKLLLTEAVPTVKPYDQDAFAALADNDLPVEHSLALLRPLHVRMCHLLDSVTAEQWERKGRHPNLGDISMDDLLQIYHDHCDDHLEQIRHTLAAESG